jgi:uncharacterized protein (TIGR00251 family)
MEVFDVTSDGAVVVRVHAQPGASRTVVTGVHGDALKVKVAAPPVDNRANEALVVFLASVLGVKPAAVRLVSGSASRTKRFRIDGIDGPHVRAALDALVGGTEGA